MSKDQELEIVPITGEVSDDVREMQEFIERFRTEVCLAYGVPREYLFPQEKPDATSKEKEESTGETRDSKGAKTGDVQSD
jgi:hypothetical protein